MKTAISTSLRRNAIAFAGVFLTASAVACSGGGGGAPGGGGGGPTAAPTSGNPGANTIEPLPVQLHTSSGIYADIIEQFPASDAPRQIAALPNGDLIVGTMSSNVYIIRGAENAGMAAVPTIFTTVPDTRAQGVTYSATAGAIYVSTTNHVYKIPYQSGDATARSVSKIVDVRTGSVSPQRPPGDTDSHSTTSVLAAGSALYISVGSSCNACAETDSTRAVILKSDLNGGGLTTVATRVRNAIALALNPATGHVWIGGAGQDCLAEGAPSCTSMDNNYQLYPYPYEYVDDLTAAQSDPANATPGLVDYSWPICEQNGRAASSFLITPVAGATPTPANYCAHQRQPLVEFPAFETHIGMAVYSSQGGTYRFPAPYNSALIVSNHGSWHENSNGIPVAQPVLALVPLSGDRPVTAVNWNVPTAQWTSLLSGFQDQVGNRYGQPAGVAVGASGSIFVTDDYAHVLYRIRPGTDPNFSAVRTTGLR